MPKRLPALLRKTKQNSEHKYSYCPDRVFCSYFFVCLCVQILCGRLLQSPLLIGALLPVLKAIKKLEDSNGLGSRNGGEASALLQRLEVIVAGTDGLGAGKKHNRANARC